MNPLRAFRTLLRRRKLDAEMAEEMRAHLELQAAENRRRGMSADDAHFAALREFGGVEQIKERARDARGFGWLDQTMQDGRYALGQMRRRAGFTVVTVLTLALAIGVNSATFGFVRDVFLRPLVRDGRGRLVSLYTRAEGRSEPGREFRRFTYREFEELRTAPEAFAGVAAMLFGSGAIGRGETAQRSLFCLVSDNYFSVLGVEPWRGRFFSAEEARPGAGVPVAVASYSYWQQAGQPADFVGSQIKIDGTAYTIVGIAPRGFGGLHAVLSPSVWLPLGAAPLIPAGLWGTGESPDLLHAHSYRLELVGVLLPGLSADAARARLGPIEARLGALVPEGEGRMRRLVLAPPPRLSLGGDRPADESFIPRFAAIALGMAASVLLVACLNLANLFLARGLDRRREIAIRLALGAGRGRVVRQLLLEGLLHALAGGALGVFLSAWAADLLQQFNVQLAGATSFSMTAHPPIDAWLLAAMFGFCLIAALAFSLVPALRATKLDLVVDLKRVPGGTAVTGRWARFFSLEHALVMGQIALALMLLFAAGLFLRGANQARHTDYGFATAGSLVANVDYSLGRTPAAEIPRRQQGLLARAAAIPGVAHAALASAVPYNFEGGYRRVFPAGAAADAPGLPAISTVISHDYFQTLGVTLLRGRNFTAEESVSERGPRVAIVDETLARTLFANENPLGRRIAFGRAAASESARLMEIVGVVRSPRDDVFEDAAPARIYVPIGQSPVGNTYLHVTAAAPATAPALLDRLRQELRGLDAENTPLFVRPLDDFTSKNINLSLVYLAALAFGTFGFVALTLALVGVYAVKACAVARRTREIGIRIALGARPLAVQGLILRQGARQALLGVAGGTGLALLAGQVLSKMLYRAGATDWATLGISAALLFLATMLACWLPARRAAKVDPLVALRME